MKRLERTAHKKQEEAPGPDNSAAIMAEMAGVKAGAKPAGRKGSDAKKAPMKP